MKLGLWIELFGIKTADGWGKGIENYEHMAFRTNNTYFPSFKKTFLFLIWFLLYLDTESYFDVFIVLYW